MSTYEELEKEVEELRQRNTKRLIVIRKESKEQTDRIEQLMTELHRAMKELQGWNDLYSALCNQFNNDTDSLKEEAII